MQGNIQFISQKVSSMQMNAHNVLEPHPHLARGHNGLLKYPWQIHSIIWSTNFHKAMHMTQFISNSFRYHVMFYSPFMLDSPKDQVRTICEQTTQVDHLIIYFKANLTREGGRKFVLVGPRKDGYLSTTTISDVLQPMRESGRPIWVIFDLQPDQNCSILPIKVENVMPPLQDLGDNLLVSVTFDGPYFFDVLGTYVGKQWARKQALFDVGSFLREVQYGSATRSSASERLDTSLFNISPYGNTMDHLNAKHADGSDSGYCE
jgi:hypothetical protein